MRKAVLFFFVVNLICCDIPGILRVENDSSSDAIYISYQANEKNGKAEKIELEIASKEKREIAFGFGLHWTDERISEYLSDIEKIEIVTENDTLIMDDKNELFQYFKREEKGYLRTS